MLLIQNIVSNKVGKLVEMASHSEADAICTLFEAAAITVHSARNSCNADTQVYDTPVQQKLIMQQKVCSILLSRHLSQFVGTRVASTVSHFGKTISSFTVS